MKQFKPVIICAAVLLVLALGAVLAMKLIPEAEKPADDPINLPSGESIKVIDRAPEEILSVEITSQDGAAILAVDYGTSGLGAQTATLRGADSRLKYSETSLLTLAGFLGELTAMDEGGEGEDASFGFDAPRRRIKITFRNGEQINLLLGNDTPMGNGAYLRREDSPTVYIVGKMTASTLLKTAGDYRDIKLFHTVEAAENITRATVTVFGKAPVTVVRKSDDEMKPADNMPQSRYKLESPVKRDANSDTIEGELLSKIISIEAESLAEDFPKDLAKYGLDTPVKLSFEAEGGISASLLIGDKAPSGGRYVMSDGVPSVIVTKSDVDFEDFSHADIAFDLLFFFKSEQVDRIVYNINGKAYTFVPSIVEGSLKGTLDGKEMSGKNPSNLFLRTIRFTISGEAGKVAGAPEIKIIVRLKGGGRSSSLELYKLNEREYAAAIDGETPVYTVNITEVRELYEAFELIAEGKDIPDMF